MFEYLKKYCRHSNFSSNSFYPVEEKEILECEKFLECELPSQLKSFYKEIGYGFLTHPHKYDDDYNFCNTNRINPPNLIVEILEKGQESGYISEDVYEDLQPGDIPFFEIGDSSSFMIMKALSDSPNAIWYMGKEKIEESLDAFIHNLFYKNPSYYADNW
jgi:hypothetical protein